MILAFFMACGGESDFDVSGSFDGNSFVPVSAFFGTKHIVFFDRETECIDTYWVQDNYNSTRSPEDSVTTNALQITYLDSNVVIGQNTIGSGSPVSAYFLQLAGEDFSIDRANEGTIEIDSVDELAVGGFNVSFREKGTVSGTFALENCVNLTD